MVRTLKIIASMSVKMIVELSVSSKFVMLTPRSIAHSRHDKGNVDSKKYLENL